MKYFKIVSLLTSALFAYLFFLLLTDSGSFLKDIGLQSSTATFVLARRASMFMLGISVLLLGSSNVPHSKARQIICLSTAITMLGLACMGSMEYINGNLNASILPAIGIETLLGVSFGIIFFKNRNAGINDNLDTNT